MDPAFLNPIPPTLPDLGPSLLGPLLAAGLVALVGMVAVVALVLRSFEAPVRRRGRSSILDGVARSVVEGRRPLRVDPGPAHSST